MDYSVSLKVSYQDKDLNWHVDLKNSTSKYSNDYKFFRILFDICPHTSKIGDFPQSFDPDEWKEYLQKMSSSYNSEIFIHSIPLIKLKKFNWDKKIDYAINGERDLIGKTYAEAAGDFYTEFLPELDILAKEHGGVHNILIDCILMVKIKPYAIRDIE